MPKRSKRTDWLHQSVTESLDDPRPNILARTVFSQLRKRHASNMKAKRSARKRT